MKSPRPLPWPEYLMEAAELGLFMLSACLFTILLMHPLSPLVILFPNPLIRRALIGIAMGLTAISIIYSPWGRRSGAHFNPAVTITFYRLGKIAPQDAVFYIAAQFAGGALGVWIAAAALPSLVAHPTVHYAVTRPGEWGALTAVAAEIGIAFLQMSLVLRVSNTPALARYTGLFAGTMVAVYITLEAPISGMSMNPARSFGSALVAGDYGSLWIYFAGPLIGMLFAAQVYLWQCGVVACGKMHHDNSARCIFCEFHRTGGAAAEPRSLRSALEKSV